MYYPTCYAIKFASNSRRLYLLKNRDKLSLSLSLSHTLFRCAAEIEPNQVDTMRLFDEHI